MASSCEPLLSSPIRKTSFPCKALLITLSLVSVISLTSFVTVQLSTTINSTISLHPSDLCTNSPNPSICHVIVADILTLPHPKPTPLHVFNSLITNSLHKLKSTELQINRSVTNNALSDCALLMDMSRHRLIDSIAAVARGANTDARTWLSAMLANHATCLDGLYAEPTEADLMSDLKELMDQTSALLAVLNSVMPLGDQNQNYVTKQVVDFPAWISSRDRKLLEASGLNGITADIVVAKDGTGKYRTVQAAVDSAPDNGKGRYVIYVKRGVYKENVVIGKKKRNLMIVGDGMEATVITGSLNFADGTTTFKSATLAANGDGLILQDLKIENTAGAAKHQAVALRVSADRSVINRCKIEAYQDTLYAHTLRQFYRDCYVSGTVDFIFGDAAVVFQNCNLVARRPMDKQKNLVTAQGRLDPNQNTGTSIQNCKIVPSPDLVAVKGSIPTYLGRPWKQYSRTVVMQSYIDSHIDPKGWLEWDGDFALRTLFYGEYQNKGPGAGTAGRVKWGGYKVITDVNIAKRFTVAALIQGGPWLRSTGVAFTEGL